ncbi:MAG: phosphoenolpyruvate synthase, partial [Syntrophobacterales bacterium]|nr:phosphoenolpyruvate synthase [Syntrophobacterales bacterium]
MKTSKLVLWFNEIELDDIPQVGGKNASLGEMLRELTAKGVNIPDGFAVTAHAYRYLLDSAGIKDEMETILSDLDTHDMHNLSEKGEKLR